MSTRTLTDHRRRSRRAFGRAAAAVALVALALPAVGRATPATPDVRIEGYDTTLFEGPVLTDGHDVRAASDTVDRRCDGTNNGMNPSPGPTATAASVDALTIAGMDFDAKWFDGFDDYYISRLGPDAENNDTNQWWGVLVDGAFTPVGGCQFRVGTGDHVLWAIDAFSGKPFLALEVVGGDGAVQQATATTSVGVPLAVKVVQTTGGLDGADQDAAPEPGASVAPVTTSATGVQTARPDGPDAVATDGDGLAQLVFSTPGWHRVKAVASDAIRSPRLDVCVLGGGMADCGPAPLDTRVRGLPTTDPGGPTTTTTTTTTPRTTTTPPPGQAPPTTTTLPPEHTLRLQAPWLTRDGSATGRVGVRWTVLDPGVGVRGWRIEARDRTAAKPAWRSVATGTSTSAAQLSLAAGRTWQLRLTVTDARGRPATVAIGSALVPIDDRRLSIRGRRTRHGDGGAWRHTVTTLARGASAKVRLARGRPAFVLRGGRATLDVAYGRHHAAYRVTGAGELLAPRRGATGSVTVRVRSGSVRLDGVGVRP